MTSKGTFKDHKTPQQMTNNDDIVFKTADQLTEEQPYFLPKRKKQEEVKKLVREIEIFSSHMSQLVKGEVNKWLADNIDFIEIDDFRFNRDSDQYHICYFYHYYVDENGEKIKIDV